MRIFITGISGFIGAKLAHCLLENGHDVSGLVFPDDPLLRLKPFSDRLTLFHGSLEQQEDWFPALSLWQPEACVHLAWYVEPGKYLSSLQNIGWLNMSLKLLESLSKIPCSYFLGMGTCAEYATSDNLLKETDSTMPETLYAASKLSFFLMGQQVAVLHNIRFGWGRLFYPYGPGEDPRRLIPSAIDSLSASKPFPASEGRQIRDYIHVEDVASALAFIVATQAEGIYNICSAKPISIHNLLIILETIMGKQQHIQFGAIPQRKWEPPFICGDNTQLQTLGWMPYYSLDTGLQNYVNEQQTKQ